MICFIKITHGSRVRLTLSDVADEDAAAAALIIVVNGGALRMRRDDGETNAAAAAAVGRRETAIPLLRAIDRARNLAVFVMSAGPGIAVFGGSY